MVKLLQVNVQNYRSLVNTRIDLLTNFTVLIGKNGVGKTNILNSILLLKKIINAHTRFRHTPRVRDDMSRTELGVVMSVNEVRYKLVANLYFDKSEGNESIYSSDLKIRNLDKPGSRYTKIGEDAFDYLNYIITSDRRMPTRSSLLTRSEEINSTLTLLVRYFKGITYYSATQFSNPEMAPISFELEDDVLSRTYTKSQSHERFLYDLYSKKKNDRQAYQRYLNTVNKLGLGLIEDIEFAEYRLPNSSIKVLPGGQVRKIERNKKLVLPSFTVDELQLPPSQLSEGTFKTLALVFYLLNDDNDLMIIEEPEVCVHHGLLGSIIELIRMKARDKQIIVSTHSDYVLDKLKPENLVVIKKVGGSTIAETLNEAMSDIELDALHKYLNEVGNLGDYWKEGGFTSEQG